MIELPNLKNTTLMLSSYDVDSIIQPLKKYLSIECFGYGRIYTDNTHLSLCNDAAWMELLYTKLFKHGMCRKGFDTYSSGYGLWDDAKDQTCRNALKDHSGMKNGMTIIRKSDDYCEFFNLASSVDGVNASFFMNHLSKLNGFADYFLEQADDLIVKAQNDRECLPSCITSDKNESPFVGLRTAHAGSDDFALLLNGGEAKDRCFMAKSTQLAHLLASATALSMREAEVVYFLAHGYTCKEIANQLKLKTKTIYYYADNVKKKLGLNSRVELCDFYWNHASQ